MNFSISIKTFNQNIQSKTGELLDFKDNGFELSLGDENNLPNIQLRTNVMPSFGLDICESLFFLIDYEHVEYQPTWSQVNKLGLLLNVSLPPVEPGQKMTAIYHKNLPFHTEMLDEFASDNDYESCVLAGKKLFPRYAYDYTYIQICVYVNLRLSLQYIFNPAGGIDNKYLQRQYYEKFIFDLVTDPRFKSLTRLVNYFTNPNYPPSTYYKIFKCESGYNPCVNY